MRKISPAFYICSGIVALFILFRPLSAAAQLQVYGRVLDKTTSDPLPSVTVVNLTGHLAMTTDAAGGFRMPAVLGDKILFSLVGYKKDTVVVGMFNNNSLMVEMSSVDVRLPEVTIFGQGRSYSEDSAARYAAYAQVLDQTKANGFDSPVDALYDILSKRQKRIWEFQKIFRNYEEQKYIESRVTPEIVTRLTGLEGDSLETFLNHYHLDYRFVRSASDIILYLEIQRQVEAFRKDEYPFNLLDEIKQ